MATTTDAPGLRERKKQRTHADLQRIATRLFLERGYQHVTIDEIAAEANVSHRTFYRYFGSKEDLVLGDIGEVVDAIDHMLRSRPVDESVLDSIRAASAELAARYASDAEFSAARGRIVADNPALQQRNAERQSLLEGVLIPFVADRLQLDPDRDLLPRLIAACTVAASRAAIESWTARGSSEPFSTAIDDALRTLEEGIGSAVRRHRPSPA